MKRTAGFGLLLVAALLAIAGALIETQLLVSPVVLPDSLLWKLVVAAGVLAAVRTLSARCSGRRRDSLSKARATVC